MKVSYLQKEGEKIVYKGAYMEAYIPSYYFDKGVAITKGVLIETLGLFSIRSAIKATDDINKCEFHTFFVPTNIIMMPTEIYKKELAIGDNTPISYHVLKFYSGDTVIASTKTVATVDNTELFLMDMLTEGKIPKSVNYDDVFKAFLENLRLNKMSLNVSAPLLGLMVAELYRDKNDLSQPFRKVIGAKGSKAKQTDYVPVNLRTLCSYSSTFSALTFEDIDSMLVTSVNKTRYKKNEAYSPIEEIIR